MSKLNQDGSSSLLMVVLIVTVLLLVGSLIFGFSAYSGKKDYQDNFDQKLAQEVQKAVSDNSIEKDKQFAEQSKQPLKTYRGPEEFGSLTIKYPRSWSAYVDENSDENPIDGYFHPGFVPGISADTNYALRVQVVSNSYSDEIKNVEQYVQSGALKVKAYRAPKVPKVLGTYLTGKVEGEKTGVMVIFPVRDKTLKVWTLSPDHIGDFNKYILPNLSFTP